MGVDESENMTSAALPWTGKLRLNGLEKPTRNHREWDVFGERLRIHSAPGPIPATAEPARRTLESSAFPDRRFTAGMIAISAADRKPSLIAPHGRIGSGTASLRLSAAGLSTWRWISRN